jgi:hypothetical protein
LRICGTNKITRHAREYKKHNPQKNVPKGSFAYLRICFPTKEITALVEAAQRKTLRFMDGSSLTTSPVIIGTKVPAYFQPTSCQLPADFPDFTSFA